MDPRWIPTLYDEVLRYEGDRLHRDVLAPNVGALATLLTEIGAWADVARLDRSRTWLQDPQLRELSWNLFALHATLDLLLLPFQPSAPLDGPARITREELARFLTDIGLRPAATAEFHPVLHEIVEVDPAPDADEPPTLAALAWEPWMLGELVVLRGGARVRAGARHLARGVADRSTLYFVRYRAYRPCEDLSHGWGSNSRWRTSARLDFLGPAEVVYNATGRITLSEADYADHEIEGLGFDEAVELLRHRCFVTTTKPSADLFPYDHRLVEPRRP